MAGAGHGKPSSSRPAGKPNRLATEPSPYLRQHALNPVDWWPWSEAAFAEAKRRDVPVFLSIGYSTCHWCHVMAHESFEDDATARALNEAFVCIKVDREERPDVDEAYMAACQLMTGHGGWPLTVLLTPDKKPFFAGTYFPRESRHGRVGTADLARQIAEAWRTKKADLVAQADHILLHMQGVAHGHGDDELGAPTPPPEAATVWPKAVASFSARLDKRHGGFGGAPKFPSPMQYLFLLRLAHRTGEKEIQGWVTTTLDAMARGGIHDHVGGGFHRYSTDAGWHLPHFEKMLYDQAMLAMAYTEGFQATGDARWKNVACGILDYVLTDLADPGGGYHAGEDADAEGEEGKYQVWEKAEIDALLGARAKAFCKAFGIEAAGNFADEATGHAHPANVLHLEGAYPATNPWAKELQILKAARDKRVRPHRDDKVLADWNGLVMAALALAGRAFGRKDYIDAAAKLGDFLAATMMRAGRVLHTSHRGKVGTHSFLDDHAYTLWGWLELHAATQRTLDLERAITVAKGLAHFRHKDGAWTTSAKDGESMVAQKSEAYDGALPSGNGVAAWCLHRLALLTGDTGFSDEADHCLERFGAQASQHPAAFPALLCALDLAEGPSTEVLVVGEDAAATAMHVAALAGFHPRRVVLRRRADTAKLAPWAKDYPPATAGYVCTNHACKQPAKSVDELRRQLQ